VRRFVKFIIYFQDHYNPFLPYGVIGGLALLAGTVCSTLKETGHTPTRETLHDDTSQTRTTSTPPTSSEGELIEEQINNLSIALFKETQV